MTGTRPPIELAVLDMAGTTVADGGLVEACFLDALQTVGVSPDDSEADDQRSYIRATMGRSKIEVFTELLGDEARADQANRAFELAVTERIADGQLEPIAGAEEVLDQLRERDIRICLTTGFSPQTRDVVLESLGWRKKVDLTLTPDAELRGRPHPDLILAAVLRLHVDDVRAVAVVGDTANDLVAGHRAGASVVAGVLTGAHTREELEVVPHTHLLESVRDLPEVLVDEPRPAAG